MNDSRSTPIIFELMGGLGNQLFQVVAGAYFRSLTGREVEFDATYCNKEFLVHQSAISHLHLPQLEPIKVFTASDTKRVQLLEKISSSNVYLNYIRNIIESRYVPKSDGFDLKLQEISNRRIRGYFQSYFYLSKIFQKPLLAELKVASPWAEEFTKEVDSNAVALHVRRGDYTKLNRSFGLLGSEYYVNAIEKLSKITKISRCYVFTDDIDTADKLTAKFKVPSTVVVPPKNELDASSLIVMSKFDNIIIANSSFSWWAASLNKEKNVVYPESWFRNYPAPELLIPPTWISCTSEWMD